MNENDRHIFVDYDQLLYRLEQFDKIIGQNNVKNEVVRTVQDYIAARLTNRYGESAMYNIGFYGLPGTGKTEFATHIAGIITAAGIVKKRKHDMGDKNFKLLSDIINNPTQASSDMASMFLVGLMLLYIVMYLFSFMTGLWNTIGTRWLIVIVTVLLTILLFAIIYSQYRSQAKVDNPDASGDTTRDGGDTGMLSKEIQIVTRSDLVDKYVGHSDKKTLAVLNKSLGGVLFIDEAYQLMTGDRDQFGQEALDAINQFMSEHPGEITIIFAGYEDKMHDMFRAQPGLKRRIKHSFKFLGYTGSELAEIFKYKVVKNGYILCPDDQDDILRLIEDNEDAFPGFAGDIGTLFEESRKLYSDSLIKEHGLDGEALRTHDNRVLTYDMVKEAYDILAFIVKNRDCSPASQQLSLDDDLKDRLMRSLFSSA